MSFNYHHFMNIALLLWGCIFCLIIAFCLFLSKNYNRQRRNLLLWMQLDTALLLLSDSLAWYFRGYLLLPLCCMLIDLFLLIQYRKRINKKSLLAMSSYIILPIIASMIQVVYYVFSFINLAICGSMILMYIVITGEQNQKLGQLAQDKQELATKFEIASILNRCTTELSSNKDNNLAINNLLKIINDYFGSDRTYIFETDFTRQIVINTYEYTLDHVSEEKENLQEVPLEVISRWMDKFRESKVYYIPTLDAGHANHKMIPNILLHIF